MIHDAKIKKCQKERKKQTETKRAQSLVLQAEVVLNSEPPGSRRVGFVQLFCV